MSIDLSDTQYAHRTGYVTDLVSDDGDGEQVDYCLAEDCGDILIGRRWVEDGLLKEERWLVGMKKETFDRLLELYRERVKTK